MLAELRELSRPIHSNIDLNFTGNYNCCYTETENSKTGKNLNRRLNKCKEINNQ